MIGLSKKIGLRLYQSAVVWTLVFAFVRTGGNLLVLPLLLHKLPAENLGLWYVFLSLAGISSLVDMGFLATMSRATAYLWAGAREIRKFGAAAIEESEGEDTPPNYPLLADLSKTMRLYYLVLGILITVLMGIFGTMWLSQKVAALPDARAILYAWLLFLLAILVNIAGAVWHPLLIGINRVRLAQQILVWGLVANYSITCVGLLAGAGLFAPVAGYLAMGLVSRTMSRIAFNRLTRSETHSTTGRWSGEILRALWPTAWRTGIVTLGIYATLNASTLICSVYLGLKATASFGLSMQLALAALGIAAAFVLVKLPIIAQLHARGKVREISQIVFPRMRWFWLSYLALALAAVLFGEPVLRDLLHSKTSLLPTPLLIGLFIVIGLEGHHAVFREITVASNQNPFAKPVVISGILIVLLSVILIRWIGLWALILAPGLIQLCFNNWWTVLIGLRSMGASVGDYVFGLSGFKRVTQPGKIPLPR
jgi:O-antigen/teichoic acid export membrane protein